MPDFKTVETEAGPLLAQAKACDHCACRRGSIERQDGWGWIRLVESWEEGVAFYCHETIPGHSLEQADGSPRWRLCAGFMALRGAPSSVVVRHLEERPMAEAIMACGIGYAEHILAHTAQVEIDGIGFPEPEVPPDVPRSIGKPR